MNWTVDFSDLPKDFASSKFEFISQLDVLLRVEGLSHRATVKLKDLFESMRQLVAKNVKKLILDIDLLLTQKELDYLIQGPLELILREAQKGSYTLSVRAKDFGLIHFLVTKKSRIPLQITLESGLS